MYSVTWKNLIVRRTHYQIIIKIIYALCNTSIDYFNINVFVDSRTMFFPENNAHITSANNAHNNVHETPGR